jgi:prophage antirepressor-like protein
MPMVSVQRNLPFSSISPSNRFPTTSNSCSDEHNSMNYNTNNHNNNNNNITSNMMNNSSSSNMLTMNHNNNNNTNTNFPNSQQQQPQSDRNALYLNSNHNFATSSSGLGIPSLQRRQSSNTAQIMDAYALESSLPMLSFPFFGNSINNHTNANTSTNSTASSTTAVPPLTTSSSGSTQSSPLSSLNGSHNVNGFFNGNYSSHSNNNSNGSDNTNGSQSGLEFPDPRRQTSLEFAVSNALPPNMPTLQHSTSSLFFNQSIPALTLSSNFESVFSPPKVPPMRHVSTGDFFPHSSSFDMGSSGSISSSMFPTIEDFSRSTSSTGNFTNDVAYPYPPTRSDSLSVPNTFFNGDLTPHEDAEVPPLSPLSTVYSSPPRSTLSTPANLGASRPLNAGADVSPRNGLVSTVKRNRDQPEPSFDNNNKRQRLDYFNPKDSPSAAYYQTPSKSSGSKRSQVHDTSISESSTNKDASSSGVKSESHKKEKKEKRKDGNKYGTLTSHLDVKHEKEKFRHVSPAVKLRTPEESEGATTTVEQIYYPRTDQPKPHRIRLIRVTNPADDSVAIYAHGADVGSVVERKSNISRLFGRFESPTEKLLMNVPGPHNHTVGQESNILTEKGMYRFLQTNKMKGQDNYKQWIINELIPRLRDHSPITSTSDAGRKNLNLITKRPSNSMSTLQQNVESSGSRSRNHS